MDKLPKVELKPDISEIATKANVSMERTQEIASVVEALLEERLTHIEDVMASPPGVRSRRAKE